MQTAPYDYILKTIQQYNILPVTSACDCSCIFCSHKNNPRDIEAFALPKLSLEEIMSMAEYLRSDKKIVIGESASRIIEGEPFIREDMTEILVNLRSKYPQTQIEITTSGTHLSGEILDGLEKIMPVELNISLNSSSKEGRKLLYRGIDTPLAVSAVERLKNSPVPFHGSMVAVPLSVGYEDIEETASFLCMNGAKTVRIFVPGFSKLSGYIPDFIEIRKRLMEMSDRLYEIHGVPILVEPPEIESLKPVVCGIIKGSPASEYDLAKGDIILKIENYSPLTRVDAYEKILRTRDPVIVVERNGRIHTVTLKKRMGEPSGMVFYYDIHPDTIYEIQHLAGKYRSKKPLLAVSELGYPIIDLSIEKFGLQDIKIMKVENRTFGGTIKCAGLLTADDIIYEASSHEGLKTADLLIVPSIAFDARGRDLLGNSFYKMEETLGIRTVLAG